MSDLPYFYGSTKTFFKPWFSGMKSDEAHITTLSTTNLVANNNISCLSIASANHVIANGTIQGYQGLSINGDSILSNVGAGSVSSSSMLTQNLTVGSNLYTNSISAQSVLTNGLTSYGNASVVGNVQTTNGNFVSVNGVLNTGGGVYTSNNITCTGSLKCGSDITSHQNKICRDFGGTYIDYMNTSGSDLYYSQYLTEQSSYKNWQLNAYSSSGRTVNPCIKFNNADLAWYFSGDVLPIASNTSYVGNSSYRWKSIYLISSPDVSSDERIKRDIESITFASQLINDLNPVCYKYRNNISEIMGGEPNNDTHSRIHMGFISQDVRESLNKIIPNDQIALWSTDLTKEDGFQSLRYEELIAVAIAGLKEQAKKITDLEARIAFLETH